MFQSFGYSRYFWLNHFGVIVLTKYHLIKGICGIMWILSSLRQSLYFLWIDSVWFAEIPSGEREREYIFSFLFWVEVLNLDWASRFCVEFSCLCGEFTSHSCFPWAKYMHCSNENLSISTIRKVKWRMT